MRLMRSLHISLFGLRGAFWTSSVIVWRCESVIGRHHYTRYINQMAVKSLKQKIMTETFKILKVCTFSRRCAPKCASHFYNNTPHYHSRLN